MTKKKISLVIIVVGAILTIVSLIADFIGLGSYPGINSAQLAGIVAGLFIVLLGIFLLRKATEKAN